LLLILAFRIHMYKKLQQKGRRRTFLNSLSPYFLIILAALIFSYVSCSIIVHQLQATAKILDSSSSAATAWKTSSNNFTQASFHKSYEILINNSRLLTQSYQNEVKKWQLKQYDNSTMISITDMNLPKFQKLINRAESLQPTTENYAKARAFYIKSLQSEMESYRHFRNFLAANNPAEDRISTQLLSNALIYESNSFAAFNNVTSNKSDNQI
jgi:hypothetical protein